MEFKVMTGWDALEAPGQDNQERRSHDDDQRPGEQMALPARGCGEGVSFGFLGQIRLHRHLDRQSTRIQQTIPEKAFWLGLYSHEIVEINWLVKILCDQ